MSATVLEPGNWFRFDSNLSVAEYAAFNQALNGKVGPDRMWTYKHTKTIDTVLMKTGGVKMRVTQTEDKGKILEVMAKKRIADFAIYMPAHPVDVRISVNVEDPMQLEAPQQAQLAQGQFDSERFKDRRSYIETASAIEFDLTAVQQKSLGQAVETKYEMEIESLEPARLLADPTQFIAQIRAFACILRH